MITRLCSQVSTFSFAEFTLEPLVEAENYGDAGCTPTKIEHSRLVHFLPFDKVLDRGSSGNGGGCRSLVAELVEAHT
jgi:hypothetical protein